MVTSEVLNGGFVKLVRSMGGDESVVEAARVTSGTLTDTHGERRPARDLIRFLMRREHMSPFEFCQLEFHVRAPIYVARQWVRHRTASWNEVSGRYVEFKEDYQRQEEWRGQAKNNRQGSDGTVEHDPLTFVMWDKPFNGFSGPHRTAEDAAFREYQDRIEDGVAREQARTCLPVSTWTEWRWSADLRATLHFLGLRASPHAQAEIRAYAEAMVPMVESVAPLSVEAWRDYRRDALTLTVMDLKAISQTRAWDDPPRHTILDSSIKLEVLEKLGMSKGEAREHLEKRARLNRGA